MLATVKRLKADARVASDRRFRLPLEPQAQLAEFVGSIAACSEGAARPVLNGFHGALDNLANMPPKKAMLAKT